VAARKIRGRVGNVLIGTAFTGSAQELNQARTAVEERRFGAV